VIFKASEKWKRRICVSFPPSQPPGGNRKKNSKGRRRAGLGYVCGGGSKEVDGARKTGDVGGEEGKQDLSPRKKGRR